MIQHDTTSIVVERDLKILLVKRKKGPELGYWCVPGGHVEKNETVLHAAKREAHEEAGNIKIISKRPVMAFVHDVKVGQRHKAHVFCGKVNGKIRAASDAKKLGWFTLEQMKRMNLTHYTKKIINKLYSKRL